MGWVICLSGEKEDLHELSKSFNTDELTICEQNDTYYLESNRVDKPANDYKQVEKTIYDIVDLLNGAAKLALGSTNKIDISNIYYENTDGSKLIFASAAISSSLHLRTRGQAHVVQADGTIVTFNPADSIPNWLKLCNKNPLIRKVFNLISNDVNSWFRLYKIYEVIIKDPARNYDFSVSKADQKRFTQTANSYKAVGMVARHALDYGAPVIPMNITEARSLIYLMVNEWLRAKE